MGSRKEDDDKTVSGEVKTVEEQEADEKRMAIREQNRMRLGGAIFSRLSRVPFVNVWLEKKVSTSRKVAREEKGLCDDIFDLEKSFNRLENIDFFLRQDDAQAEAAALAAESKLAEERRKAAAQKTDDEICEDEKEYEAAKSRMKKEYERKVLEANYKIQLDPLEKAVKKFEKPEPEPKKKTTRGRSEKQKLRAKAQTDYEREIKRIEATNATAKAKAALTKSAAAELEKKMVEIENMP
jgi:hypothetical protein